MIARELEAAGISAGLLRCSVGLEDLEDLLADFEQALEAAAKASSASHLGAAATAGVAAASQPRDLAPAPVEAPPVEPTPA